MSVAGISSSNLFNFNAQSVQNRKQEFQQLGQDLQSGNLSAAQADFATLQKNGPQASSTASSQNSNPVGQDVTQLAQDLQSGNLSAAQQDYTKVQQDFQNQTSLTQTHSHHHHHHSGGESSSSTNSISQIMDQLGQALQSGSLSSAQQAYSSLQQDFKLFSQNNGLSSTQTSTQSNSGGVSVSA